MENKGERDLRLLQLRFIGKILAGFTHESKNYIAIVKESAGLIGDMIQLGKNPGMSHRHILRSFIRLKNR